SVRKSLNTFLLVVILRSTSWFARSGAHATSARPRVRDGLMSSDVSVTRLIGMLKEGDRAAAQQLWEAYFARLVGLARGRMRSTSRRFADEEDVALSAFDSFYRRAEQGQFPQLEDRDDLWQVLFVITVRKAINLVHYQGRASRGGGRVQSLADL